MQKADVVDTLATKKSLRINFSGAFLADEPFIYSNLLTTESYLLNIYYIKSTIYFLNSM